MERRGFIATLSGAIAALAFGLRLPAPQSHTLTADADGNLVIQIGDPAHLEGAYTYTVTVPVTVVRG